MDDYIRVRPAEARWLMAERARAIRDCPGVRLSHDGRHVVEPVGVRGYLHVSERIKDGRIVATVYVLLGADAATRYVRSLRCLPLEPTTRRTVTLKRRT